MIDINAALGMTSERPLQVGDWVALIDPQPEGVSQLTTDLLCKLEWPRRVTSIANPNAAFVDGFLYCCDRSRFRRVDPPRDEVAELREQLAEVTRERDDYYVKAKPSDVRIAELIKECDEQSIRADKAEQDRDTLREQLATVQAEAAAMRRIMAENESRLNDVIRRIGVCVDTGWITHELRHVLQEYSTAAGRELLDKMKRNSERIRELENVRKLSSEAYEKISNSHADLKRQLAEHKLDADEANKALATVQAEAAAMFRLVEKYAMELREEHDPEHFQAESQRSISYELDLVRKVLDGTAGRELLDELKRNDERIADLERQLADHKRDAELCRELREWIKNGVFSVVGNRVVIGCQCVPTGLAELLILIRNGGAK